jgi:hypothetical protein
MKYFLIILLVCSSCSAKSVNPELVEGKKKVNGAQSLEELRSQCAKILRSAQDEK